MVESLVVWLVVLKVVLTVEMRVVQMAEWKVDSLVVPSVV